MTASEPIAPLEAGHPSTPQQEYPWVLKNPKKEVNILILWGLWTGNASTQSGNPPCKSQKPLAKPKLGSASMHP